MGLGTFAPGPYTATYNSDAAATGTPGKGDGAWSIGIVENVQEIGRVISGEDVTNTNLYGQSVIGSIYTGGNAFVILTVKEWKARIQEMLWPISTDFGAMGAIGQMLEDRAGKITLTPVAGSAAYTADPYYYEIGKAIVSPSHNTNLRLGPTARDIPLVFRCFPYNDSGTIRWFKKVSLS